MIRLKWIGTGCLAATLLAGPVFAQSAASVLAQKMSPNSLDSNPGVVGSGSQVADESSSQLVPAVDMPARSAFSGLATSGGRGKSSIDLGKESDDPPGGAAKNIFDDPATLKMLGENPRFVYKAENLRDPMLIPWVRRMAIFKELIAQADTLIQAEKYDDAMKLYRKLQDLEDERFTSELVTRMAELEKLKMEKALRDHTGDEGFETEMPSQLELPAWVSDNTKAALVGENGKDPVCLIGDFIVKEGDSVPGYKYVKVKTITKKTITYQIGDATFDVDLETASSDMDSPEGGKSRPAPRKPARRR